MTLPGNDQVESFFSIGDVLDILREEFPDITISKIRFLESQGLITPERTASGFRKFYQKDILRLKWVLEQQKSHFLPLKVIKDKLGITDAPKEKPDKGNQLPLVLDEPKKEVIVSEEKPVFHTKEPESKDNGVESLNEDLPWRIREKYAEFGFIEKDDGGPDELDNQIIKALELLEPRSIEPRHLKFLQSAVEREANLIYQVILPLIRQRTPKAAEEAKEVSDEIARLLAELHEALLKKAIKNLRQ
jgi:DNA-binding transcriptional MerR regulator